MLRKSITDVTFASGVLMEISWEGYKLHCVLIGCQEKNCGTAWGSQKCLRTRHFTVAGH